jgi:hypothetical protein
MEDKLKEICKILGAGMKDTKKGSLVISSKEDISIFPKDHEIGQAEAKDEVIYLYFFIFLFNEHKHMLRGDE